MDRVIRVVRNVTFLVFVAAAVVAAEKRAVAESCSSYFIGFDSVDMEHCGPFTYNEEYAIPWMHGEAVWRCSAYCGLPEAYLYWWYREGDVQDEAYYTSSWSCGA